MLRELPDHLTQMALFCANTGCRDGEVSKLRWDWEVAVPDGQLFVFIVPGQYVKNGDDRLEVLNSVAKSVVEARRGQDETYLFTFQGERVLRMMSSAWLRARKHVRLPQVRVHDLKHTFSCRLRAAGVSFVAQKACTASQKVGILVA